MTVQVHGVDVEGKQLGIDEELVALLGRCSPVPVTYAGGARTLASPALPPDSLFVSTHWLRMSKHTLFDLDALLSAALTAV